MLSRQRFVHRNTCQPGGKLRPSSNLAQMFVCAHIGVLHYILTFVIVTQDSPRHAVEPLIMTAHDDFKQSDLARQHAGHNFLVTQGLLRSSPSAGLAIQTLHVDGVTTAIKVTGSYESQTVLRSMLVARASSPAVRTSTLTLANPG